MRTKNSLLGLGLLATTIWSTTSISQAASDEATLCDASQILVVCKNAENEVNAIIDRNFKSFANGERRIFKGKMTIEENGVKTSESVIGKNHFNAYSEHEFIGANTQKPFPQITVYYRGGSRFPGDFDPALMDFTFHAIVNDNVAAGYSTYNDVNMSVRIANLGGRLSNWWTFDKLVANGIEIETYPDPARGRQKLVNADLDYQPRITLSNLEEASIVPTGEIDLIKARADGRLVDVPNRASQLTLDGVLWVNQHDLDPKDIPAGCKNPDYMSAAYTVKVLIPEALPGQAQIKDIKTSAIRCP